MIASISTTSTWTTAAPAVIAHCVVLRVVRHATPISVAQLFADTLPDFSSGLASQACSYGAPGWTAHCSTSSSAEASANSAADSAANTLAIKCTGKHRLYSNNHSKRRSRSDQGKRKGTSLKWFRCPHV
ncbi:hypothetical protein DEV91_104217 [Phyllobacterium brassicacearum]|nr:hypothetical protein DEV91_104217 [Phyllobacterium brassicacearum]